MAQSLKINTNKNCEFGAQTNMLLFTRMAPGLIISSSSVVDLHMYL